MKLKESFQKVKSWRCYGYFVFFVFSNNWSVACNLLSRQFYKPVNNKLKSSLLKRIAQSIGPRGQQLVKEKVKS